MGDGTGFLLQWVGLHVGGFWRAKGRGLGARPQPGVLVQGVIEWEGLHPLVLPQVVVGVGIQR